jgi:hypothetical protein
MTSDNLGQFDYSLYTLSVYEVVSKSIAPLSQKSMIEIYLM